MANTTSTLIQELYTDVVADLIPYFMDAVLLPNQEIILNSMSIAGQSGNNVRFPLMNTYQDAVSVSEGGSIGTALTDTFNPTEANVTVSKRGIAIDVTEESLEDGGIELVRSSVLTRMAGGLAQATDVAGLAVAKSGATLADTGAGSTAATHTTNFVMSPEALAYVTKREPSVKMWFDPDTEVHQMRGTVRNGFVALRGNFINPVTANATVGTVDANIVAIAKAVAQLRGQNAPTTASGHYVSIVDPALEFAINQQISLAGGSAIGSLSDIGNRALNEGLVGQAAGAMFFRSNNLPDAT